MADKSKNSEDFRMPGMRGGRGPGASVEKAADFTGSLKRLLTYFAKEKGMVIALLSVVAASVVVSVLAPDYQSKAIDTITAKEIDKLPRILIIMAVFYVLSALGSLLQSQLSARLSQRIVRNMRVELFDKIVNLPTAYLDSHPHGDIMSRMTNDVENISNTVSQSLVSFVSGILTIIGTVFMMVYLCWQLALVSCISVILTVILTKYMSGVMAKLFLERQNLLGKLNSQVEEMVTGCRSVAAYNRQDESIAEFNGISDDLTSAGIKAEVLAGSMGPAMNVVSNFGFVLIAAFGGYFALHGTISIGVISAFIVYAKQFGRPINEIAQLYGQIQTAIACAERVFGILDQPDEDKSGTEPMGKQGLVSFRHVNFSYVPEKQVLFDFNLEVPAGKKIALVGSTGSGKTTVVNLLMRFYDVDSGEILVDGTNIKDIKCDALRDDIAIVLQDTVLFADTIRSNLTYANPNVSQEQIDEAAKMCYCYDMIQSLKGGYEFVLTENGENLSQGQRQLLSIGRAVLDEPTILILDEATSSVDTRTEKHIQQAMARLMKDRTSIIIAHRLSTIQDADQIVVMDQGHIAETGTHEELLAKQGIYYNLYMTQFAGKSI
jgi:ATP-binding cassette, subfamily B, multidrug efflux pump